MNACARDAAGGAQRGFAMLAVLFLVGFGSLGVLIAVQTFLPATADVPERTERSLAVASSAARVAFRRNGSFPTSLDNLATAAGIDRQGSWRIDPWLSPNDVDYRRPATGANVRSRGRDGRLNTADDVQIAVIAEDLLRARQRGRLRMLRAILLTSSYFHAATMSPAEVSAMQAAMHTQAIAHRSWLTADAATRTALQGTLSSSAATITSLRSSHGLPAIPTRVVGANGLMQHLGLPDSRATDGQNRNLLRDPTIGLIAAGYDRRGGTDDDM